MPYFTYHYDGISAGTDWEEYTPPTASQVQLQYEEWQREEAEKAEDRKKYPLFFWRENIK